MSLLLCVPMAFVHISDCCQNLGHGSISGSRLQTSWKEGIELNYIPHFATPILVPGTWYIVSAHYMSVE